MQTQGPTLRPRGRPRGFRHDEALDAAVRAFWTDGFDGTSVDTLCRATGMPRASLYQDFGGKEGLFLAAVARYADTRLAPVARALGPKRTLAEDLTDFFDAVVALATQDSRTPGCLVSCVLAEVAGANETFRRELDIRFSALEARLADRLLVANADLPESSAKVMGQLLAAVARGIMLRARSGAGPTVLRPIAALAVNGTVALLA